VTDVWSDRADAYRKSPLHREGEDLDLIVEWADPRPGRTALDVATGGGHVARRLRAEGCDVVTLDPSPGMQPDVIGRAEDLPFADASFDVVATRIAAHHFEDVAAAVREMARVSRELVLVEDTLYESEQVEEAERLHDPSHVRSHSENEWRTFLADAGLEVEQVKLVEKQQSLDAWLARTGCVGEDAERVRELLAHRIEDGIIRDTKILFKARKARA
jgi:ubiquinone/menaquinone biosynthesis C-methylase UbiE